MFGHQAGTNFWPRLLGPSILRQALETSCGTDIPDWIIGARIGHPSTQCLSKRPLHAAVAVHLL